MKRIDPILENDLELLKTVLEMRKNGRNKRLFERVKSRLESEWQRYINVYGDIAQFVENDKYWSSDRKIYINLYEHAQDPIDKFKRDLKEQHFGLRCCPYCGLPSVNTIDHYFPKSRFPQFSFLFRNLVPSCYDCNRIKDDKAIGSYGQYFFHPYFDDELKLSLVRFSVSIKHGMAVFTLGPAQGLDSGIKKIVDFQIKELNLSERLTAAAKTPWLGLLRQAERNKGKWDKKKIIKVLNRKAQDSLDDYDSSNNIFYLVFTAIASSAEAISFLEKKSL